MALITTSMEVMMDDNVGYNGVDDDDDDYDDGDDDDDGE